jgi:hypothetical protein
MSTLTAAGISRDELRDALLDVFNGTARFNELIVRVRGVPLDIVATGNALDEIAMKVITRAESESWLSVLIETAWTMYPNHPGLTRIRQTWQVSVRAMPSDHAKALMMPGKTVLINRKDLRAAFASFRADDGSRVLVVDGDPLSGKTYTLHYVSYLATALKTIRPCYVDLERVPRTENNTINATRLGDAIGLQLLGETFAPPKDLNILTWLDQYGLWLEQKLPDQPTCWLVIDNFRRVSLEESALDLVADLAMRTYRTLPSLRLVLLSYGDRDALQARVVGRVEYEPIGTIDTTEIIRFFSQLYREESVRRRENPDDPALIPRVRESVERVMVNIPRNGVRRLEALCRTAWIEADRVLSPPVAPEADPVEAMVNAVTRLGLRGLDVAEEERE